MREQEPIQLLKDPDAVPGDNLFKEILKKDLFQTYTDLKDLLVTSGLSTEWRYYNDGKAWLCKVTYKKKTVFWLSLWDHFFRAGFYFTENTGAGIKDLDIGKKLMDSFVIAKPLGKLIPLTIDIENKCHLNDLKKIIDYKLSIK